MREETEGAQNEEKGKRGREIEREREGDSTKFHTQELVGGSSTLYTRAQSGLNNTPHPEIKFHSIDKQGNCLLL